MYKMKERMHGILSYFSAIIKTNKRRNYLNKVLMKSVAVNGNGTSGYTVKSGRNKGKILGHISIKHPNKEL